MIDLEEPNVFEYETNWGHPKYSGTNESRRNGQIFGSSDKGIESIHSFEEFVIWLKHGQPDPWVKVYDHIEDSLIFEQRLEFFEVATFFSIPEHTLYSEPYVITFYLQFPEDIHQLSKKMIAERASF